jgi:hypothetical protein
MSRLRRNTAFFLVGLSELLRNAGVALLRDPHPMYSSNEEIDEQVSYCTGGHATVRTRSECE